MASVQAASDSGDNDTDYDAGDDDDSGDVTPYTYTRHHQNRHGAQIGHHEMVMTPRSNYVGATDIWRTSSSATVVAAEEVFMSPNVTVRGRAGRVNELLTEASLPSEDTHPSSMATTPSPPLQPVAQPGPSNGRRRSRGFGQDLIIESPSPAPPTQFDSQVPRTNFISPLQDARSSSKASDAGSAHSSATNNTNASNGASFYRTYYNRAGQGGEGGTYTPDLVFAEIGHGRGREGREATAGPGPSTMMQSTWRSESDTSSPNDEIVLENGDSAVRSDTDLSLGGVIDGKRIHDWERARHQSSSDVNYPLYRRGPTMSHETLPWINRRDEHDASSPIPYLSVSPTTRELHESVQAALSGARPGPTTTLSSTQGLASSEDMMIDGRGRNVKRSFRNTLNAAEQYASALFFGRNGSSGPSSAVPGRERSAPSGASSSHGANGRQHNDRH